MNIAYIMRGIPGSGKSTVARLLAGDTGVVHSTDDYFMVDGEYQFDPSKLAEHHDANFVAFCRSLKEGYPVVVCDNTNIQKWNYQRYVEAAEAAGYMVALVVMSHPDPEVAKERSFHGASLFTIQRMIALWEP